LNVRQFGDRTKYRTQDRTLRCSPSMLADTSTCDSTWYGVRRGAHRNVGTLYSCFLDSFTEKQISGVLFLEKDYLI
jgi:hypothetical protein